MRSIQYTRFTVKWTDNIRGKFNAETGDKIIDRFPYKLNQRNKVR